VGKGDCRSGRSCATLFARISERPREAALEARRARVKVYFLLRGSPRRRAAALRRTRAVACEEESVVVAGVTRRAVIGRDERAYRLGPLLRLRPADCLLRRHQRPLPPPRRAQLPTCAVEKCTCRSRASYSAPTTARRPATTSPRDPAAVAQWSARPSRGAIASLTWASPPAVLTSSSTAGRFGPVIVRMFFTRGPPVSSARTVALIAPQRVWPSHHQPRAELRPRLGWSRRWPRDDVARHPHHNRSPKPVEQNLSTGVRESCTRGRWRRGSAAVRASSRSHGVRRGRVAAAKATLPFGSRASASCGVG